MYQPVVDLASGCCVGAEALARWQRDNGEWVGPNVFIPVAESIDLVPKITMAVLSRVVSDLPLLQALEPDLRSEEHTSELQSLMRISYAVFCLKKKKK